MIVTLFATLPITAGAETVVTNSDAWIFSTDDTTTIYSVAGRYFTYNGSQEQFTDNGSFAIVEDNGERYIKLNDQTVAQINTTLPSLSGVTGVKVFADSVYVKGDGTNQNPYEFYANYVFYTEDASSIASTTAIAIESENEQSGSNGTRVTAHPGDGFAKYSRFRTGDNKVQFLPYDMVGKASANYLCVGNGEYGPSYKTLNVNNSSDLDKRSFNGANSVLYYLGKGSYSSEGTTNDLYQFSEVRSFKHSFGESGANTYTVMWKNDDGTLLEMDTYSEGETPRYSGSDPSKQDDALFSYTFSGWSPDIEPVTADITYTATYTATPSDNRVNVSAWIFSTSDGKTYDDLAGKVYSYGGSTASFHQDGGFSVSGNTITLAGVTVADIEEGTVGKNGTRVFAGTVYVTGSGTNDDPYVFTPNYIYSAPTQQYIRNGVTVATGAENYDNKLCDAEANPGDGFSATARIRTGTTNYVQFLPDVGYITATKMKGYLGVGAATYGDRYSLAKAYSHTFSGSNEVLYYYGKDEAKDNSGKSVYLFSESTPPLRSSFDPTDSQIYTVTWENDDGASLGSGTYYYHDTPKFNGTPTKTDSSHVYTFSGWKNKDTDTTYGVNDTLPQIEGNVTYVAQYTVSSDKRFVKHSLSLDGDIGVIYYIRADASEVNSTNGVVLNFSWYDKTDSFKLRSDYTETIDNEVYYKAKCYVAAAEMTYNIRATITVDGVLQDETDDYSVKKYADEILKANPNTFENQDKLTDLVMKMLDYGAKAQVEFDTNTSNPANKGVEYEMETITYDQIPDTKSAMKENLDGTGLQYMGTSLIFLTKTTLRHYYKVTDQSAYSSASVSGDFTYGVNEPWIYYEVENIPAAEYGSPKTLTIGSNSYQYSVYDYAWTMLKANLSAADNEMAIATYWYGEAAKAYFPTGGN